MTDAQRTNRAKLFDSVEDAARWAVRQGRSWLNLTETDIDRGARAIISDPIYRAELLRDAMNSQSKAKDHMPRLSAARRLLNG